MFTRVLTTVPDNTNQADYELYAVIGEYDNAGYPLAYCLLTTATAISDQKRTKSLVAFLSQVKVAYKLNPSFVHTDKDIAEIKACQEVFPSSTHRICFWHFKKAIRERLAKKALATTAYDPSAARAIHNFIDTAFAPKTTPNSKDNEDYEYEPNACPPRTHKKKMKHPAKPSGPGPNLLIVTLQPVTSAPRTANAQDMRPFPLPRHQPKPTYPEEMEFCPGDLREDVVEMMERHLCMHPSIPGPHAETSLAVYD